MIQMLNPGSFNLIAEVNFNFKCVPGSFPGMKWSGREINPSLPSNAEVKNGWSCTSAVHVCLSVVDKESFIFTSK
jgi:hypothetical protein